jgi:hypothetical protein
MRSRLLTAALVVASSTALSALGPTGPNAVTSRHFADSAEGPGRQALDAAFAAYERAIRLGAVSRRNLLTVIDYARPSIEPRLWVLDLDSDVILYHELVAHGRSSGENIAMFFSNDAGTYMSSLGLFVTEDSYTGRNGYSLRLRGLDAGVNDNAHARAIVIHGAAYVSSEIGARLGRLGRSWGCPAVRSDVARPLIDAIKGGSVVYVHGPRSARLSS